MKLFIKELKGNEVVLDIQDEAFIADVKRQVESKLNIPVAQQKLIYLGKILQDSSKVKDYKIQDNAKLMLTRVAKPDLKKLIHTHFNKFYDSETATAMTNLFIENMKQKLKDFSLDDLDRFAEVILRDS
ncbi:CLUMA_CG014889, isoform A [Clunio marinus]|uniref:CLUMA_CG014889, isoform A n=1 Tax=Clunio marinus TaxID=568069 RepID=A0A1J1IN67_9DIPT|nr:CLUMA_CG014889, isoform A [Clunio marinus]